MNMKRACYAVLLAGLVAVAPSRAQDDEVAVSASLDVAVLSAYVWRGQVLDDDAVVQPSLTVSKGGFSINWWGNFALTDDATGDDAEFSEHDISVSYSAVCPLTGADMTIGVVNYDFPNVGVEDADGNLSLVNDTREAYVVYGLNSVVLAPTLSVYYDFKEADGFYGNLGVSHGVELSDALSASLSASIGYGTEDYNEFYYGVSDDEWNDVNVSLELPFAVNDSLTLTPSISYTMFVDSDIEDAGDALYGEEDYVYGGVTASYAF